MNARACTVLLLALFAFSPISPASADTKDPEIEREFRRLQRFEDYSATYAQIFALVQHLTRLDPLHAPRYLTAGLQKISPDPRDIKTTRDAASAEIYAAKVSAVGSMVSGIGQIMAASLKSNQAKFQSEQNDAKLDAAGARASIDAEIEFVKKMNHEMVEITKRMQTEIARTPHPVVDRTVD